MTSAPWLAQVRAQVQSVRKTLPEARAIAIRLAAADGAAPAPAALRIGAEELPLFRADSVLALRERLVDLPDGGPPLVVLTDLREAALGNDLRARLAQRRIFSIDAWQLVKEQFQARNVDPRLTRHHDWAARALLDAQPEAGYARVPSGFLDAETAWRHLFETLVGTRRGARDPEALLAWALDGAGAGNGAGGGAAGKALAALSRRLEDGARAARDAADWLVETFPEDPGRASAGAAPFLEATGLVAGGWMLARGAAEARRQLAAGEGDPAFLEARIVTAGYFAEAHLSRAPALLDAIVGGGELAMALDEAAF